MKLMFVLFKMQTNSHKEKKKV